MYLPQELIGALESVFEKEEGLKSLTSKALEISQAYRSQERHDLGTRRHALAYIASRLPATYASTRKVLEEISTLPIRSLLELGSGAGVAIWAAKDQFMTLKKATLVERNPLLIALGQEFTKKLALKTHWIREDLCKNTTLPLADLVVAAYVSGELPLNLLKPIIKRAYQAAQQAFILIEPGTPRGFERILKIRQWLLEWGVNIVAPCSHQSLCPLQRGDWCHFSTRLSRSSLHRLLKEGEKAYEDEKFSYLIASAPIVSKSRGTRILKAPIKRGGHVTLDLCAPTTIDRQTISRKRPIAYKKAKKSQWGDVWLLEKELE